MKHLFTSPVILLAVLMAQGQDNSGSRPDSLRTVLSDTTLPVPVRLKAMYNLV